MSLTVALNTAVSGLFANQQAIAATSENIANVNTADFSRRQANFFTDAIPDQFAGVSVEISRAGANRFLQGAGFNSQSDAASTSLVSDALSRIEASLGAPGENQSFANKLDEAFAAFVDLSATPSSTAAKAVAINALDAAFAAYNRTIGAIDTEIDASTARLDQQVSRANVLLEDIFNLNQIVSDSGGAGDQIDAKLRELSSLIDITVSRSDDGRVSVTSGNGAFLVNAGGFSTLDAASVSAIAQSGEIGALVSLINTELPALRSLVAGSASDIANEINSVYAGNASVGGTGPGTAPLIVSTNGVFAVNSALISDPGSLAVARPAGGGAGGANDGAGASAIAALAGGSAGRAVASVVADLGAASLNSTNAADTARTFASEIDIRLSSERGVNLDEELSNLIQYQRSYSANARVISAVDELFQTVLNIL